jgi:hypothetical protein
VTTNTTNLRTPARPRARFDGLPLPATIAICVFSLIAIAFLVGKIRSAPAVATVPTPGLPIVIIATPAQPLPTPAMQVAAVLPRFVVCYDQPVNGAVLGPIPAPDASAVVARYGASWVMTPWNGGYCWLRAADVGLPDVADLAPAPQPQVIYVAAQPAPAAPTPEPGYYQVTSDQPPAGDFSSEPPPALQTLAQPADEEPLTGALLREAQDR